jgi:nicotinamide-nucleotide amidase
MKEVNAAIITIGDELLIGQTIDTNSAWMAKELNTIGVWVKRRVAVGDNEEDIRQALDEESKNADIILLTGGLGPTADDITKPLLCDYFGGKMVRNEQVLQHVHYLFEKVFRRKGAMLERNLKQADVPDNCTVLMNERGTAPGMWFEKNGKVYVSLPGVPHEMKGLMQKEVLPRILKQFQMPVILHQNLLTFGIGESMLAEEIKDWEEALPPYMKLAYLPHYGMVRLRLTATGDDKNDLEQELEKQTMSLKNLVKQWLIIDEDLTMQQAVAKLLKERKQTVGTAESCTGGYIAHLLTMDAGASSNYKGTVVSYDNQVKKDLLGVSQQSLDSVGAVSEEVVIQMVKGVLQNLKTDYALATSGIMGPDGGTEKKPVGTVWVAVGNAEKIETKEFHFRFDRTRNIEQTSIAALAMLQRFIKAQGK